MQIFLEMLLCVSFKRHVPQVKRPFFNQSVCCPFKHAYSPISFSYFWVSLFFSQNIKIRVLLQLHLHSCVKITTNLFHGHKAMIYFQTNNIVMLYSIFLLQW
jgi:hypothetical protein